MTAPSTLPTDREIEEAKGRLEAHAKMLADAARRFAGYHRTCTANGENSNWDARAEEEGRLADDISLLLSRLSSVEGELAGKQIDSSSVSQKTNPLQVALNEHYPAYVRAEAERVMEIPDRTLHGAPSGDESSVSTVSDPMLEEFTRLNDEWLAQQAKNRDLWIALVTITGHYDARSEIYTNDADLAEAMAGIARQAIKPGQATQ